MNYKEVLIANLDKLHTTKLGIERIKNNINCNIKNVIVYCKELILNKESFVYKQGKNLYVELGNVKLTINSYSYTIITAHKM